MFTRIKGVSTPVKLLHACSGRDCGLACALMVLRAASVRSQIVQALRDLCPTTRCGPAESGAARASCGRGRVRVCAESPVPHQQVRLRCQVEQLQ